MILLILCVIFYIFIYLQKKFLLSPLSSSFQILSKWKEWIQASFFKQLCFQLHFSFIIWVTHDPGCLPVCLSVQYVCLCLAYLENHSSYRFRTCHVFCEGPKEGLEMRLMLINFE